MTDSTRRWRVLGDRAVDLSPWAIVGVLNVTPDSFSDGGRHTDVRSAVAHAVRMVVEGATMIDVGAESTRPGADRVAAVEQLRRAMPVVTALSAEGVAVSIDTTSAEVAEAALECGAVAINDVSAGLEDPRIIDVAARRAAGLVLMHRLREPESDRYSDRYAAEERPRYGDVVREVRSFLAERRDAAVARGVDPARIAVDPGLGFGKTVDQNYDLIARIDELDDLGAPVLVGASRKSFLGAASGAATPEMRGPESVSAAVAAYLRGARLFRVHDVEATRRGLAVAERVVSAAGRRPLDRGRPGATIRATPDRPPDRPSQ